MARVLTSEEYAKLAAKFDMDAPDAAKQLKQAHRLLCEGRQPKELTPLEQFYAEAFQGATLVQIPNDYGWEPGVEVAEKTEAEAKAPKPKKEGK